jgi:hypothetical protein
MCSMKKIAILLIVILSFVSMGFLFTSHNLVHSMQKTLGSECLDHCMSALISIARAPQVILTLVLGVLAVILAANTGLLRLDWKPGLLERISTPPSQFRFATVILRE